jgi:hypothetical protein
LPYWVTGTAESNRRQPLFRKVFENAAGFLG